MPDPELEPDELEPDELEPDEEEPEPLDELDSASTTTSASVSEFT